MQVPTPMMLDMAELMTQSPYTEETIFDFGISGELVFLVVVPQLGACRVPIEALSHFNAGEGEFTASGMPEHYTGTLSGEWTIKRDRLRILPESWQSLSDHLLRLGDTLDRTSAQTTRVPDGYFTIEQAALQLNTQLNGNEESGLRLIAQFMRAAEDELLSVRDPMTLAKYSPPIRRMFYERVTVADVNACLEKLDTPYRWTPKKPSIQPLAGTSRTIVFSAPPSLCSIATNGTPTFNAEGYEKYLLDKAERNSKGRYTVAEAAQVLADAHGLEPAAFIDNRMLPAIAANLLRVIDPADGGPLRGRKCNVYADEVTPAGIDAWLSAEGFAEHVRWPEPAAISAAPDATKPPEQSQTLTTNEIAQLFDGIAFAQDRWVKNIGQSKWLASANRSKGEQGGAPATWCPLTIAQLVYDHEKDTRAKQKTLKSLNSRFRTNPVLKPWKDAWDDYYGMFTEPGEA